MRFNDAVTGFVLILFAAAMFAVTLGFPAFPGQKYGPSLFPRILSVAIAAGGAVLVLRGLANRRAAGDWVTLESWTRDPGLVFNFAVVVAALGFYVGVSEWLGFMPTAFLILAGLVWRLGSSLVVALLVALGTTIAMQWFFGTLMRVPLPRGVLDIAF